MIHLPVLEKEVLKYLDPKPNQNFVDCTVNGGGHTKSILKKNSPGRVLGIEADPEIYSKLERENIDRLVLVNDNYINLEKIIKDKDFNPVNGILFDLGMSSWHVDESERGFSFQKDQPLDMRYNPERTSLTAREIINNWPIKELERILREYGEERFARRIAKNIDLYRQAKEINTTKKLVEIIIKSVPGNWRRIHPATRTFQALRITVNSELENLRRVLPQAERIIGKEGKLVVISFHSLEDRIIKNFLKGSELKILTKKPVTAGEEEKKNNRRSRSAKLRAATKI